MKNILAASMLLFGISIVAEPVFGEPKVVCEDGMCRLVEEDADAEPAGAVSSRMALGYMQEREFLDFLAGKDASGDGVDFAGMGVALLITVVFLGGLAMNLTPCILPMVPVNLMIIGASAGRGALYGLGMTLAYGTLGLAAAVGGLAFGTIQADPWFNLAVAVVFLVLAFSLCGFFAIDLSRHRASLSGGRKSTGIWAFLMGALSAVLAGACVAPVLIALLVFTADLYSKGNAFALALPFVMGAGMAAPWPLAGAGMKVLPRPGAWMKWVNRVFALIVFAFALWYARLAFIGFSPSVESASRDGHGYIAATVDDFSLEGLKRPVLVDCWASWCKNCSAMDAVLARPAVAAELKKFTFVKLRAEDISKLVKIPSFEGVKGLPAFVLFE